MSELTKDQAVEPTPQAKVSVATDPEITDYKPIKKSLPAWVVLIVLAICAGAVYAVYTQGLKEPPPHFIKGKGA